jgi:hypothetical protein
MYMYNPYTPLISQQMYDPSKRRDKTQTAVSSNSYDPSIARKEQEQYYLNNLGILDPRRLRSASSIRSEITGPGNNNSIANSPSLVSNAPVLQQQNPNTQDIDTSALAPYIGNAPAVLMQQGQQQQPDPVLNQPFYPTPDGNLPDPGTPEGDGTPPPPPPKKLGFGDKLMRYMSAQEARGETPLSQKLIAAGAAMQGASHLGGNAAMAAAGQAYNDLAQSDMDRQDAYAAAQAESMQENMDLLNQYDAQDQNYTNILQQFDKFEDTLMDATGLFDGTVGSMIDKYTMFGNPEREAFRYQLRQTIVDNTLLNTAQTKGAISDREMALFQSGVPSLRDNAATWRAWIKARQANLRQIKYRLANNIKVSSGADIGFDNTYTVTSNDQGSESTQAAQRTYTEEEDEALFNIPRKQ